MAYLPTAAYLQVNVGGQNRSIQLMPFNDQTALGSATKRWNNFCFNETVDNNLSLTNTVNDNTQTQMLVRGSGLSTTNVGYRNLDTMGIYPPMFSGTRLLATLQTTNNAVTTAITIPTVAGNTYYFRAAIAYSGNKTSAPTSAIDCGGASYSYVVRNTGVALSPFEQIFLDIANTAGITAAIVNLTGSGTNVIATVMGVNNYKIRWDVVLDYMICVPPV